VGSQVKAGDLIAQLNSSNQQVALAQAQQALNQLTSASAIATAKQAVVTAQKNLINAQLFSMVTCRPVSNQSAIDNAQAALALAQTKLTLNQNNYKTMASAPLSDPGAAAGIPGSIRRQQAYTPAWSTYNAISSKSTA